MTQSPEAHVPQLSNILRLRGGRWSRPLRQSAFATGLDRRQHEDAIVVPVERCDDFFPFLKTNTDRSATRAGNSASQLRAPPHCSPQHDPPGKRARIDTSREAKHQSQRREKHRCAQQQPTKAVLVVGCSTTNKDLPVPDVQTQSPSLSTTNSNETVGRTMGKPDHFLLERPVLPMQADLDTGGDRTHARSWMLGTRPADLAFLRGQAACWLDASSGCLDDDDAPNRYRRPRQSALSPLLLPNFVLQPGRDGTGRVGSGRVVGAVKGR
jgi:hypothetical protein